MQNIKELRDELAEVFTNLKKGKIENKTAAEMNNAAGKMINTVKLELEYSALNKSKKKIEFLEY